MKVGIKLRIIVILLAVGAIFYVLWWEYTHSNHEEIVMKKLSLTEDFGGLSVDFKMWEATNDEIYYLILPAAFQRDKANFEINYDDFFYQIYIDGQMYRAGAIWQENLQEQLHSIQIRDLLGRIHADKQIQVLKSGELPVMMVTVEAKDELYDNTDYDNKRYVERGELSFFGVGGEMVLKVPLNVFKVRGNLTADLPKKPFTFTLAEPITLCGMEEARSWNLLANLTDGSHIRNKIMLDWAGEVSQAYEAESAYVELFINGEYQGLYLLTETIEMGENRLEYDEKGLLIEMEMRNRIKDGNPFVKTNKGHTFAVHTKEYMSDEELAELETYLNEIEGALYAEKGRNPDSGKKLSDLIDMDSWTDTWLLREISADHDLGVVSQFAYVKDWSEKDVLFAGPAWDFDGTLGNGMVPLFRNPRSLVAGMIDTKGIASVDQNRWLAPMYRNEEFKEMLIAKFKEEYEPKIDELINVQIDGYVKDIRRSALIDSLKWNSDGVYNYIYKPEEFQIIEGGDYHKYDVLDIHVQTIKDFLQQKKFFLEELWIEEATFEVLVEEHYEDGMNHELNNNVYTWIRKE